MLSASITLQYLDKHLQERRARQSSRTVSHRVNPLAQWHSSSSRALASYLAHFAVQQPSGVVIAVSVFLHSLDRGCIRLGVQVGKRGQSVMWVSVLAQLPRRRLNGRKIWLGRPIARCPGCAWKWVFHSSPRVLREWSSFEIGRLGLKGRTIVRTDLG